MPNKSPDPTTAGAVSSAVCGSRRQSAVAQLSRLAILPRMDPTSTAQEFRKRALKKETIGILGCLGMAGLFTAIAFAGYMPGNPPFGRQPRLPISVRQRGGFSTSFTGPWQHMHGPGARVLIAHTSQ